MSGETDEKATKVFRNFGVLAHRPFQHRPWGRRGRRVLRTQSRPVLDHYTRQATASRPARDSRYLAPNDKVAEPTLWFLMAAPAALR